MIYDEWYIAPEVVCKHGDVKDRADQERKAADARQKKAFDFQMSTLTNLRSQLEGKYLNGPGQGFDPTQLALMKSQFLDTNAQGYNQARQGVASALASRGSGTGQQPVGGDYTRGLSGLYGAQANAMSSGLAGIDIQNLQQALTNKFNTASIFSGNAATLNSPISTFGGQSSQALGDYSQAALQPGFGSTFLNYFGGALGGGLGKALTGGDKKT